MGSLFKGLSPAKAYLEGRLMLAACFKPRSPSKGNGRCIVCYECHPGDTSAALKRDGFYMCSLSGGEQDRVFVGDIEIVDREQVLTFPSRKRLYFIENAVDDTIARSTPRYFMSMHGGFAILDIPFRDERECRPIVDGMAIGFDEDTVCVIEGGPEVVQGVPKNRWRMPREASPKRRGAFPFVTIALGSESIFVRTDVSPKNTFKLFDVMFGPFGF